MLLFDLLMLIIAYKIFHIVSIPWIVLYATYDDRSKLYQLAQFGSVFGYNSSLWRQLLERFRHCTDFNINFVCVHNTLQWLLSNDMVL